MVPSLHWRGWNLIFKRGSSVKEIRTSLCIPWESFARPLVDARSSDDAVDHTRMCEMVSDTGQQRSHTYMAGSGEMVDVLKILIS